MNREPGVRLVLGFSPGSLSDHIARMLCDALAEQLGTPLTIELKPGYNGIHAATRQRGISLAGHNSVRRHGG